MKKFAIILIVSVAAFFGLGGRTLLQDPVATIEAFVVRHADVLPLEMFGNSLFDKHCAGCHDNPAMHAPTRQSLAGFSKESLMIAMEFGKMQPMAAHLNKQERGLIAMYLSGSDTQSYAWLDAARCDKTVRDGIASGDKEEYVGNWGLGKNNQRFASNKTAGITKANVATLELAWSFAFPKVTDMRSQPVIIGDTMYVGDKAKKLYAIDRKSGCVLREADFITGVRSSITLAATLDNDGQGKPLLIFADSLATVYAVDPMTFDIVWQTQTKLFEKSVITGTISYDDNKLFVPISSYEVAVTGSSSYVCCRSHGGVIALDSSNGEQLWQWHATENATLQGLNADGLEQYGPSGASVWTTPMIDKKRGRIYFGTGENLSHPATNSSDSIFALDIETGKLAWHFQATKGDVWNAACWTGGANCPENAGGDVDFGASVILTQLLDGSDILLAGQKSGEVYALNPDPKGVQGELIWKNRVSLGTTNGGIHWGMAASGQRLIIPVSDPERDRPGYTAKPGLYALDIADGKLLWSKSVQRQCDFDEQYRPASGLEAMRSSKKQSLKDQYACSFYYGLSSAATATPELAFSAGLDGVIRAYDIENGDILWQTETAKYFQASNGIEGHGGAIDVVGQVLADGWLYVFSGYSMFGQLPGNMLLAYKVKEPLIKSK
ncbi:MAG: PQQ-binding-like beta-propeller repeat protein [Arenicella sp.]|nr:PQQ-binding-like beta-propeller repeat protein [Arenicella sp.]